MSDSITVTDLVKNYGENHVLRGISFRVPHGTTFALLGVNGAGKTTTLECIEGLREPTSGSIQIDGRMGVQLQSTTLPALIKGEEALRLFSLYNHTTSDKQLNDRIGMSELLKKPYSAMSAGQKRRLHLALAMLGDPDILILDEPTAGLDVEGRSALHEEIRNLQKKGKTILLASHDLAEVEELTDHIAILKDGQIAFSGSSASLRNQVGNVLQVAIKGSGGLPESVAATLGYFKEDKGYRYFTCADLGQGLVRLIDGLTRAGITIEDLVVSKPSLEQRFLEIARKVES